MFFFTNEMNGLQDVSPVIISIVVPSSHNAVIFLLTWHSNSIIIKDECAVNLFSTKKKSLENWSTSSIPNERMNSNRKD